MLPIRCLESRTVVLPYSNIDTDQIIPARFLTTTTREGLGRHAFADWRYAGDGEPRADFVLNQPQAAGCAILIAGRNFGCGSSREHAAWALLDCGLRAVISSEIADIFRSNALKNGLLPLVVDAAAHHWLLEHPGASVRIDLETCTVTLREGITAAFTMEAFARHCLLNGVDELGFLLQHAAALARYERARYEQHSS
jgi:3-isopropylmalate/(R)-2-methylmalate dehydratase small subunit